MKMINPVFVGLVFIVFLISVFGCSKVDVPEGAAKIYLTAASNPIFKVPDNPKRYFIAKESRQLVVPVYVGRSGLQKKRSYSVDVFSDHNRAQEIIDAGGISGRPVVVAPDDVYALPAKLATDGEQARFDVAFDANKLLGHLGKQLLLSVRIANPSAFELNTELSNLNILLDVDLVMLGAKIDVTNQYLKNSGNTFIPSVFDGTRRGVLADWITSPSVKNYAGGTLGGYDKYGEQGFMSMERYHSPEIPNGKIYQKVRLPAGMYELAVQFLDYGVTDPAYIMVAGSEGLPDIDTISEAIAYSGFSDPLLSFSLPEEQEVSIGVLAHLIENMQWLRIHKFTLYQYQNLFD